MSKKEVGTEAIYDARSLGAPKMLVLGFQHMFAMFGATVLVPIITGLSVSTTLLFAGIAICASAQDNMEAFRHLSVDAEIGLHGIGVELALPIQKHLVLKAGYNFAPQGDLFNTYISIDTKDLK